jgi:hypothetical protein
MNLVGIPQVSRAIGADVVSLKFVILRRIAWLIVGLRPDDQPQLSNDMGFGRLLAKITGDAFHNFNGSTSWPHQG